MIINSKWIPRFTDFESEGNVSIVSTVSY